MLNHQTKIPAINLFSNTSLINVVNQELEKDSNKAFFLNWLILYMGGNYIDKQHVLGGPPHSDSL
tara:strand:- start:156 stop:350 length:195 start_codon:yes stop_codon:yes gene_type:complete